MSNAKLEGDGSLIERLTEDERFQGRRLEMNRGGGRKTALTEDEREGIIAEVESIEDPEKRKRAILMVPDAPFRRDLISAYIRLFRPLPEVRPMPEPEGEAYIARKLPDGSTVYEPMTVEQWREAKREAILAMPPGSKRRKEIADNIELFR